MAHFWAIATSYEQAHPGAFSAALSIAIAWTYVDIFSNYGDTLPNAAPVARSNFCTIATSISSSLFGAISSAVTNAIFAPNPIPDTKPNSSAHVHAYLYADLRAINPAITCSHCSSKSRAYAKTIRGAISCAYRCTELDAFAAANANSISASDLGPVAAAEPSTIPVSYAPPLTSSILGPDSCWFSVCTGLFVPDGIDQPQQRRRINHSQ